MKPEEKVRKMRAPKADSTRSLRARRVAIVRKYERGQRRWVVASSKEF